MSQISNIILYISFFTSLYFEVFLLISFLENRTEKGGEKIKLSSILPSVTIIVPAFNEEKTISKTIYSLLKLDYPKDKLKIIAVNDGSTDDTAGVLKTFRWNKRIEVINKKNGGKYTALNAAIRKTETELVGCLDADSFVPPDTLTKIIPHFENQKIMAVTPAIKIFEPDRMIRHVQSNEYNLGIFMKKSFSMLDAITVTPGPFSIFRKTVFDNLGLFHEAHNTEDLEIAMRMQKNGYRIGNAHDAVVYTVGPGSFAKLYRQRVRWVSGFLANSIDYRSMFFNPKHKHLGLFMLPMSVVGIVLFMVSVGMVSINILRMVADKYTEIKTIGFNWVWNGFHFDWFFINTDSKMFLGLLLFLSTILLVTLGKQISDTKNNHFSFHTLYFPLVYGIFSIAWLSKAIYLVVLSKNTSWR
ncbi:MAG: glycosyltransferase family 2 protein [Patescibacteria group bacterium]